MLNAEGETTWVKDRVNDLYYAREYLESAVRVTTKCEKSKLKFWSGRVGHLSEKVLKKSATEFMVVGIKVDGNKSFSPCKVCLAVKLTNTPSLRNPREVPKDWKSCIQTEVCQCLGTAFVLDNRKI